MNEQNTKKILFNKSALLSLKAELLKKQEEVQEVKHLPKHNIQNFKPHQGVEKNDKSEEKVKRSLRDNLRAVDAEEIEACRKAKVALEKKAELYEHLSDGAGNSQLALRFLVDFKGKKPEININNKVGSTTELAEPEEPPFEEDENEWIEFTDFLGRTRKCLKSDLEHYKNRDKELIKVITDKHEHEEPVEAGPENSEQSQKPLLVQKTNDYLQLLRKKWEKKENELLAKDKDIHYQDLLFDEARIHGVSYYSFSTDETERNQQMEELKKRREETLRAQQQTEEIRKKRDKLIADRVAAARARQRVRAGLPPEDPKDNEKDFTTCLLELLNRQKNEVDKEVKEEEKRIRDEKEKERQKLREAYVRDWDIGKDGVKDNVKKFKEMTQEEYVEQQRARRIDEFAPQKIKDNERSKYKFDSHGKKVETTIVTEKTWSDVRPVRTPSPPLIGDINETQGLRFTTKKPENVIKYKNFVPQESIPINNELSDEEYEKKNKLEERAGSEEHAEIAPPPTYDYYGPVPKCGRSDKIFSSNMREAMAQGSKSLEHKESNRKLPSHYDFTFD